MGAGPSVSHPRHRDVSSGAPAQPPPSLERGGPGQAGPRENKGRGSKRMDKLRRSFRDSFRKRRDLRSGVRIPEACKPHQWQEDETAVRAGTCSFPVKYLGCIQVFESRGMDICEEALKQLRNGRRRLTRGVLYVSGDGLRVVDDETKGLIVDQTIEKVSFCAPDRNHDRGFSYICRDGTTRRWMCHGFLALRDSGERLSHAVGCAFGLCLERKQQRDKDCTVAMTFDAQGAFTRLGSFRTATLTERIVDPQDVKPSEPPPVKPVVNPYAIERPHAAPYMLERQGSFRGFPQLNTQAPFKRQLSLRLCDLPSTLERARQIVEEEKQQKQSDADDILSLDLEARSPVGGFAELTTPETDEGLVSALAQEVSQGLSLLSGDLDKPFEDSFTSPTRNKITSPEEGLFSAGFNSMFSTPFSPTSGSITSPNGIREKPHSVQSPLGFPSVISPSSRPIQRLDALVSSREPDPFNAEWAKTAVTLDKTPKEVTSPETPVIPDRKMSVSTNPFLSPVETEPSESFISPQTQKAFEIQM